MELLSGGAGILVPPRNPDALSKALRRVVTDPAAVRSMADKAADLAPMHNWTTVATSYKRLGASLIPRSTSPLEAWA